MKSFDDIYAAAAERKGAAELEDSLPVPESREHLLATTDDRWLASMTQRVFSAGFVWRVIEAKWPGFEAAFDGFDPEVLAELDGSSIDALAIDERIVRNRQKIVSVPKNAAFVRDIAAQHGTFGAWVADWPAGDTIGLWDAFAKRGARLGGMSGPLALRFMGKDTFLLTPDVVEALIGADVIDKKPTSKKARAAVQVAFNTWHQQSGRPLCQISKVLACAQ